MNINPDDTACMELIIPPSFDHPQYKKTGRFRWRWYEDGKAKEVSMGYEDAQLEMHNFIPERDMDDLMNRVLNFKRVFFNKRTGEVFSAPREPVFTRW